MNDKDYDSYELSILDNTRIQPLLEQIRLNDLSFKFFISSVYWSSTSYDVVQKHNKEIRRTIRSFFKNDIRMWFFIEKHQEGERFHRHILLEDAPSSRWKNPTSRMRNFLMEDPESFFACTLGNGLNDLQKMEILKKVFRLLPFIPNGKVDWTSDQSTTLRNSPLTALSSLSMWDLHMKFWTLWVVIWISLPTDSQARWNTLENPIRGNTSKTLSVTTDNNFRTHFGKNLTYITLSRKNYTNVLINCEKS